MMSYRRSQGVGMIDALIALAVLAFGVLALSRHQGRLVVQATDALARNTANQFSNELMAHALVDPGNLPCYTVPVSAGCGSTTASTHADDWGQRLLTALPGAEPASVTAVGTQLTIVITWRSKDSNEMRQFTAITDVQ
jgi:Tfp pilus assembly protein PilV